jgi:cytochrome c peroxidase
VVNFPFAVQNDPQIQQINAEITAIGQDTVAKLAAGGLDQDALEMLLGKAMIYDRTLSVNSAVACATCHMPEVGFTGASELFNLTTVAFVGAVGSRVSARKPQSYAYAPFSPPLHFNQSLQDFVGGNFWDMRATGNRIDDPAAEQAEGPPINPVEMASPDLACVVYRLSKAPYRPSFEQLWGPQAFQIAWPADVDQVCSTPAGSPQQASSSQVPHPNQTGDQNPTTLSLSTVDRGRAEATFDQMALAISAYESGPDVSPFTSKFDYVLQGKAQFTAQELQGQQLFDGKGKCNQCHVDSGTEPFFTDFTSINLGLPKNTDIPYYYENQPDQFGYVANPQGFAYVDEGVGGFLSGGNVPNTQWVPLAPRYNGRMQIATTRNVDRRPFPTFVKAYMHNGYLKSLKEVVHFYNTRDTLPRCASSDDPGAKTTCWPAPEVAENVDTTIGSLGLSPDEEDAIVAFMTTLTDGYDPATGTISNPSTITPVGKLATSGGGSSGTISASSSAP